MHRGCPEAEVVSPSRLELLGAATPMGPDKDSPASVQKSSYRKHAWKFGVSAAGSSSPAPGLFAERLRASLPAPAADGTVLQCGVPPASAPVEAVEDAAPLPPVREGQAEAAGAEPPLPGAPEGTASARKRCRRRREGHPYQFLFSCSCDRPGCYEEFDRSRRSPLQRFCSWACRHALQCVLERERRWRERGRGPKPGNNARRTWHPLRR